VFLALFGAKIISKMVGLYPTVKFFKYQCEEGLYYTLMMSTGLTFGTISALFGLSHGVIDQAQYSYIVATVIGSAVINNVCKCLVSTTAFTTRGRTAVRR
jgi:glutathione-regulated potassium-efflux system ancillary protein KefC